MHKKKLLHKGEKIGMVTEDEKREVEKLFIRKNALEELLMSLNGEMVLCDGKDSIYEKATSELEKVKVAYGRWWNLMCQKYKWKSGNNSGFAMEFKSNEVYLVTK